MNKENKIEFISFSWKRFLASLIFLAVAILNIVIFGVSLGRHIPTGSVFTFEGPSYFFTSGLVPFLVGIFLLFYCILSYFKGSVKKDEGSVIFSEKRFKRLAETKIDNDKIIRMHLTNNEIAIKYLWLFLLVPYLIINYYYMIVNFNQPFLVDPVNTTALVILISIVLSAVGMVILFAFPQWLLTIYTEEGKYEIWFEPFPHGRDTIKNIALVMGISENEREEIIEIKPLKNLSLRNIILAITFLAYGIFNVVSFMTTLAIFQTIIVYPLIFMGVYLFSKELRKLSLPSERDIKENLRYNIQSKYYQEYFYMKKCDIREVKYQHNDFEVFWGICTGFIFIFIPFKIIQMWIVLNETNIAIILDNAIVMTLIGGVLMFLVAFHILVPTRTLLFRSNNSNAKKPFDKTELREKSTAKEKIKDIVNAFRLNLSDPELKRCFIKRAIYIIICVIISIILLMWQYFFYFNLFSIFNYPL